MSDHPCKYWVEGCTHADKPFGEKPSAGVCRKVCQVYEGPDRGLGDTLARFTRVTGIARVVEGVAKAVGKECGCAQRRARLNEVAGYGEEVE